MTAPLSSSAFLLAVWGLHVKSDEFVCLSSKKGDSWKDHMFRFGDLDAPAIDEWIAKRPSHHLYFCPLPFSRSRRDKTAVARSRMLWSDIDEADPHKVEPSILWESSPGRHQGLWVLPDEAEPSVAADMSRKLAYHIGADRGGWDLTQVLRIPGTFNLKYPDRPPVRLLKFDPTEVLRKLPQSPLDRWRRSIPLKLLRIIEGPAEVGRRSDMLWYLEHELCDLGVPLDSAIAILRDSDWNKYRGRADEAERFASEREKLAADRAEKKGVTRLDDVSLRVESFSQVLAKRTQQPGWLVEGYWMRGSHGIVAGEPKSFKTTLLMELMFAITSCKPLWGVHEVKHSGPTLMVQNENADWIMRDRLQKLSVSRGVVGTCKIDGRCLQMTWPRTLDMHFINQQGFTLDDAGHREALESIIDRLRPAMVVLDPLYLMFSGDVNSAQDLQPVLTWLLRIRQDYGCAIIPVHHYNKGGATDRRGGQRMLGSTTLHGWIESAWYIQAQQPAEGGVGRVTLDREFRGAGIHEKIDLVIEMGDFGDPRYSVKEEAVAITEEKSGDDIVLLLSQSTDALSKSAIAKALGLSRYAVDKAVDRLVQESSIQRRGERYFIGALHDASNNNSDRRK